MTVRLTARPDAVKDDRAAATITTAAIRTVAMAYLYTGEKSRGSVPNMSTVESTMMPFSIRPTSEGGSGTGDEVDTDRGTGKAFEQLVLFTVIFSAKEGQSGCKELSGCVLQANAGRSVKRPFWPRSETMAECGNK